MSGNEMRQAAKTVAAISAVLQYIKSQEEAIAMQSAIQAAQQPQVPQVYQLPAPVVKPWALNGRQAQMQLRNLMQLRAFRKL